MIRIPRPLRVALAGTTALVTISAVVTTLVVSSAQAAPATKLLITPAAQTAAAGTCLTYTVNASDALGGPASDSGTIQVTLTENPETATQDVDFCIPAGATNYTTYSVYPHYVNVQVPAQNPPCRGGSPFAQDFGCTQFYAPGPSITTDASDSPSSPPAGQADNPDGPDDTSSQTGPCCPPDGGDPNNNSNFLGKDYASFHYSAASPSVTFGVVGLVPGATDIDAHAVERNIDATTATATFRTGGRPGVEASDAARTISISPVDSVRPIASATHTFTATVRNATGDTLLGADVLYLVVSGPGTNTAPHDCGPTDNSGVVTCSYTPTAVGVDNLKFYVNQSTGSATFGFDPGEPNTSGSATTTGPPVAASQAYTIDLTPDSATTPANGSRSFTAAVTSSTGAPAQGVGLTFTENGPGVFRGSIDSNGTSVTNGTTDATGRVVVTVDIPNGVSGTETITVSINSPETTQCQTTGGKCTDTSTNTISGSVSPSPSPSSTKSPTPTPSSSGGRRALSISVSTPDIQPTDDGVLNVSGQPNASVELRCYTRPSTTYTTARGPQNLTSSGNFQFIIHPGENTRCYVRYAGDEPSASTSAVINVHTTLSLSTVRTAVRTYVFQGRNLPRRSGQLITLYRIANGQEIRTSNLTTDASGVYRVTRKFTGTGTFQFRVRTSQTLTNAPGASNIITVAVH